MHNQNKNKKSEGSISRKKKKTGDFEAQEQHELYRGKICNPWRKNHNKECKDKCKAFEDS